jgi:non-specific serine/threonine protein kinase/serine/threonine-protein kinase
MTPERWQQIKSVLDQALDLAPSERAALLDRACSSDSSLRKEVEVLLASDEEAGAEFLNEIQGLDLGPIASYGSSTTPAHNWIGRRVGPYKIVEQIGVGGMGEVYRAFRADDQYKKQVALKVVRGGQDSAFVVSRFRNERQILASLDHPNIAHLHDGGTTEDGVLYFVMELIEGQPIDQYCIQHEPSVPEILGIFQQVCSAVQYAHQRLIIHRDIKPGNILVASDGTPKLLDFGIAKILDTDAGAGGFEPTLTVFRVLTPGYASPEQVRGEPITTASDVYSLGVVLYELLTGSHPYRRLNSTPQEIARAVCEVEPPRPSTVVRRIETTETRRESPGSTTSAKSLDDATEKRRKLLRGDLDNIVLMALRKDPQRRYVSVEQFAEDIRRHLGNLPVLARNDTIRYRTSKFVTRHRAGVTAAAVVLVTLLAAIAITARQAQIARRERARAEQRFNDVRTLANSLIFEIHDSIQNLPGATAPRKLLLDRALQYLDSLARESSGDVSLQRELAAGYLRIGSLQGSTLEASLGQTNDALASFTKAVAIREAVAKANPSNLSDQLNLATAHRSLARMLDSAGQPGAREQTEQALAITERLVTQGNTSADVLGERSIEYEMLSDLQEESGDQTGALDSIKKSLVIRQDLLKANPQDKKLQRGAAIGNVKVATALSQMGSRAEALEFYRSGLDLLESLARDHTDARASRELAVATYYQAGTLMVSGDTAAALSADRRALAIIEPLAKADPENATLQLDHAGGYRVIGMDLVNLGNYREAQVMLHRAIQILEEVFARNPADLQAPRYIGISEIYVAEAEAATGKAQAALESYRRGIARLESPGQGDPDIQSEAATGYVRLGRALAKLGRRDQASASYRKALAIAEPLASAKPPSTPALYAIADAFFGMGELSSTGAANFPAASGEYRQRWIEALDWYRKSELAWSAIPNPGAVTPSGLPCGNPKAVAQAIAESKTALAHVSLPPSSRSGAQR